MTEQEYRDFVEGLDSCKEESVIKRLTHAILGNSGEAGEVADVLKKRICYHTISLEEFRAMLVDEVGDQFFYLTLLTNVLGVKWQEVIDKNVLKLKKRFPEGHFDKDRHINRDKDAEQKAVEDGTDA
jgi:NTP pyrophosphatase (non-canonical NTP hydrolase)